MKKQSSIEWLVEQFDLEMQDSFHLGKINQAKEMHKQEIMDAHESGVDSVEHGYGLDYYNETFKSE